MYNTICYKKNFLKSVIVRIDFATPVEEIRNSIPAVIDKIILPSYPIKEPQTVKGQMFELKDDEAKVLEFSSHQLFIYHSKDRSRVCNIDFNHIDINYFSYDKFETMQSDAMSIFKAFVSEFQDIIIGRLGLRYINEINLNDEPDKLNWIKYIDKNLIGSFEFLHKDHKLARSFHNITSISDDVLSVMQYGMHNPDFPAPIKKKIFILDIDSSYTGITETSELEKTLLKCHEKSQSIFESSITQELRGIMNAR